MLWFALILTQAHADWVMGAIIVMLFVTMNIAGLGAFITALLAPRASLPAGAEHGAAGGRARRCRRTCCWMATGTHVDFSGFHDNAGLFAVSLAYGLFVSAVGGGIGAWLAQPGEAG